MNRFDLKALTITKWHSVQCLLQSRLLNPNTEYVKYISIHHFPFLRETTIEYHVTPVTGDNS